MARSYDITFACGDIHVTTRGHGNTRSSAERSARHRLRDKGHDPKKFSTIRVEFATGEGK